MKYPLLILVLFLIIISGNAQEKLTNYLGGVPQSHIKSLTFKGKFYGFQSETNHDAMIWRFNPADHSCDTLLRVNPKKVTKFYGWLVFHDHLLLFVNNKMFELDDSSGQLILQFEWTGMKKVQFWAETNQFLLLGVYEEENGPYSRIIAFDPVAKVELNEIEDVDIAGAIDDHFSYNKFDDPYGNEVWMNEYQGVPGVYRYSLIDKDVKIPTGAEELQGQMMKYKTQFDKDQFFALDTSENVWHFDLAANIARIVFQVPDSVKIGSSITEST